MSQREEQAIDGVLFPAFACIHSKADMTTAISSFNILACRAAKLNPISRLSQVQFTPVCFVLCIAFPLQTLLKVSSSHRPPLHRGEEFHFSWSGAFWLIWRVVRQTKGRGNVLKIPRGQSIIARMSRTVGQTFGIPHSTISSWYSRTLALLPPVLVGSSKRVQQDPPSTYFE